MCFCFFTGSKSDVRHRGLPFKPLKSPKSLETCQKGLARGCFKMCFFTGSKSDVRHRGLPFKPLKSLKPLETCQKGLARGCSKMFFYRIRKRRETSGPARQTPQTPQIPHQNAASKCVFFTGSKSDVRHRGLPFKPLKSLKPLETCQKGLARGCSKMFFYRVRKRRETSGPARQTPQTPQIPHQNVFFYTGSKSDVIHRGLPFKPLKPLKSLKPLETCQKGLARGCSKMFFYRVRKRRETSGPARQTPQTPQIPHQNVFLFFLRDPKATLDIGACPSNPSNPSNPPKASKLARRGLLEAASKCVFLRDPRATLDIGACPSNPSNPSNPSKLARRGLLEAAPKCFFKGSESDVRHQGLPVKPRKPLKSLIKMCFCFFYGIQKRR